MFSVKQAGTKVRLARYTESSREVNCMGWIVFSIVAALAALAIPVMQYSKHFN